MDQDTSIDIAQSAATTAKEVGLRALEEIKFLFPIDELKAFITFEKLFKLVAIILFYVIYRIAKRSIQKTAEKKLSTKAASILTTAVRYSFYVLISMYILSLFNIKLSAIWGAAGIAGVALGFAAQTSVSNLISGLFVITEKSLKIGDFIEIDGISGTVDTIGFLSVRVHTLDNQFVRIPNSTIINNKLKNFSTFSLRRHVFEFSIDYATDLDKAIAAFETVPALCPTVITDKPDFAPRVMLIGLGASGITVNIAVWFNRTELVQTRTDLCRNVIKVCRENGINIPFNRMDVTLLQGNTIPQATVLGKKTDAQ